MTVHRFAGFALDERRHELTFQGQPVRLAPQPFRLLATLAARRGELVTRAELERALWGEGTFVDAEAGLNFCVRTLRRVLASVESGSDEWIETVPRLGYRMRGAVHEVAPARQQEDPESPPHARPPLAERPPATAAAVRSAWGGRLRATALLALFAASAVAFVWVDRGRDGAGEAMLAVDVRADGRPDAETVGRVFEAELVAALLEDAGGRGQVTVAHDDAAGAGHRLEVRWLEIPSGLRVDLRLLQGGGVVDWQESVEWSRDRWNYGRSTFAEGVGREVAERVWPRRSAASGAASPALERAVAQLEGREPGGAVAALDSLEALVAAEPRNASALALLASARFARWDLDGCEAAARRALELDPDAVEAERALAGAFSARARHDDALAAARRARRLAPFEPRSHAVLARALLFAGRNQEVVAVSDAGLAVFPELKPLWRWRYLALLALGEPGRAGEALSNLVRLSGASGTAERSLDGATMAEIRSEWRAELDGSRGLTIESPAARAALHALLGEREAAFSELERSIAAREESAVFFAVAPWFETLRSDTRFRQMVVRVAAESRG